MLQLTYLDSGSVNDEFSVNDDVSASVSEVAMEAARRKAQVQDAIEAFCQGRHYTIPTVHAIRAQHRVLPPWQVCMYVCILLAPDRWLQSHYCSMQSL